MKLTAVTSVLYCTLATFHCYCYISIILDRATVHCYRYIIILDIGHRPLLPLYQCYIGHWPPSIVTVISVLYWTGLLSIVTVLTVLYWTLATVHFYCYISIILDIGRRPLLLLYHYYIRHWLLSIVTVISVLYWTLAIVHFTVISVLYWTLDMATVHCYCYISIILDMATPVLLLYHYIGHWPSSIVTVISVLYWTLSTARSCLFGIKELGSNTASRFICGLSSDLPVT